MGPGFLRDCIQGKIDTFDYLQSVTDFAAAVARSHWKAVVVDSLTMTGQLLRICTLLCDDLVSERST
jgi:hypothetical protein